MTIEFFWNGSFAGTNHCMVINGKEIFLGRCVSTEKEAADEAIYIIREDYEIEFNIEDIVWKWGGRL